MTAAPIGGRPAAAVAAPSTTSAIVATRGRVWVAARPSGALLTHTARTAYGLGRNARSKICPVGLVLLAVLPALLAIGVLVLFAQFAPALEASEALEALQPIRYSTMFPFTATLVFLFCAAQAPELFGRDQLAGALPLYFSRAVGRMDYALARLLGLMLALRCWSWRPSSSCSSAACSWPTTSGRGSATSCRRCWPSSSWASSSPAVVGTLSAAIAALTPRRAYATVAIVAVFLIPRVRGRRWWRSTAGCLGQVAVLLSPADVLDGVNAFLFGVRPDNYRRRGPQASTAGLRRPRPRPGSWARWPCCCCATGGWTLMSDGRT